MNDIWRGKGICPVCGRSVKAEDLVLNHTDFTYKCPCETLLVTPNMQSVTYIGGKWRPGGTEEKFVVMCRSFDSMKWSDPVKSDKTFPFYPYWDGNNNMYYLEHVGDHYDHG